MPTRQNPHDLRRNSDIIDQQPTVNRFMDQKEIEWQTQKAKEENGAQTKNKKGDEEKKEGDKEPKGKKPNEEEDESKYFCCS